MYVLVGIILVIPSFFYFLIMYAKKKFKIATNFRIKFIENICFDFNHRTE